MKINVFSATVSLNLPTRQQPTAANFFPGLDTYNNLVQYLQRGNNRWGMQAFMLAVQGNILAPIALLIIQYHDFGYQDYFATLLAVLFLGVLVANLAQLPVRFILNLFLTNLVFHAAIIAAHLLR